MTAQNNQLTIPASALINQQAKETPAKTQVQSAWATFTKRFWSYTEETSKSDTTSFNGLL